MEIKDIVNSVNNSEADASNFRLLKETGGRGPGTGMFSRGVSNKELVFFTRELAILLNASVPVVQSLSILSKQVKNKQLKAIVTQTASNIEGGMSLSTALMQHPEVFNNLFVSLVKTGEVSGTLDQSLNYMAEQLEKDYDLRRKVKGALSYPIFVLVAMFGILALLFTFVMPKMLLLLEGLNVKLPLTTRILIATTDIFQDFWWIVLILFVLIIASWRYAVSRPSGKVVWDRIKIRLPVMGKFLQQVYIERFARNFGILVKGGVPIVQGLRVSSVAVSNKAYETVLHDIANKVENGRSLSQSMSDYPDYIPTLVSEMIDVGEQTSTTDEILSKIAVFYQRESEQFTSNLTQFLEPVIILILGGIVAIIVSGVLLPIYTLITTQQ